MSKLAGVKTQKLVNSVCPKIKFENSLVAFVDFMGFKELLSKKDSLQKCYDTVFKHLDDKAHQFAHNPSYNFKKLMVSDSIIMAIDLGAPEGRSSRIARFVNSVGWTQYVLAIQCNIWTRGAIASGPLFIDEPSNILVGQAFVDAWELEKEADFPRVIVHPGVCKTLDTHPNDFVNQVNSHNQVVGLLVKAEGRIGGVPFHPEAIQVDWFKLACAKDESLNVLFSGVRERMTQSTSLFRKARSLCIYFRESYSSYLGAAGDSRPHLDKIEQYLSDLGY